MSKTVNDLKPFTTVQAAIEDSEGGFAVYTQGPMTGLLVINKGIPYGFTYPRGDFKQTVSNVFIFMNEPNPDAETLELRNSLVPMDTDKQLMLGVVAELVPMHVVLYIPAEDFETFFTEGPAAGEQVH